MIVGIDANRFFGSDISSHEQVLINLLKGFQENGVGNKIHILCHRDRYKTYKKIIPDAQFSLINSFYIVYGKMPFYERIIRKIKMIYNQYIANRAMKKFAISGIDVYFFSTKRTLKKRIDIPSVFNPHDIQNIIYPERWSDGDWLISDFTFRDYVICISDFDRTEMLRYLPDFQKKIVKIYDPIMYCDDIFKGERQSIVCLNVNMPHKNCITILKAYSRIIDKTEYKLTILGNFSNEHCLQFIKDNNLDNNVEITGYISEEELCDRMRKARLFVSASTYEGFGMTPVEAIIQGVPTIVFKGTASFETTQGLATYYDDAYDDYELSCRMMELLNKPINYNELLEKSKKLQSYYNYNRIAEQYWNLFELIVKES